MTNPRKERYEEMLATMRGVLGQYEIEAAMRMNKVEDKVEKQKIWNDMVNDTQCLRLCVHSMSRELEALTHLGVL